MKINTQPPIFDDRFNNLRINVGAELTDMTLSELLALKLNVERHLLPALKDELEKRQVKFLT